MNTIVDKIIGQKIKKVIYSEVNDHNGKFYYEGFDTFDHGINVQMQNGYWWNFCWKDDEVFELGEGLYEHNKFIDTFDVKSWDATDRWNEVVDYAITDFKVSYIDDEHFIPSQVELIFENGRKITLLIAEELNLDGTLPRHLGYDFGGELYVFHNEGLLHEKIRK